MLRKLAHFEFLLILIVGLLSPELVSAKRLALAIGNDNYQNVTQLQKAGNDASAMALELKKAGFEVTLSKDLNYRNMVRSIESFTSKITGGDEVVVFYAGHGVQLKTGNYLLPTDIDADSAAEIEKTAYSLDELNQKLSDAKPAFTLVIADACRSAFQSKGRSIASSRGLSAPEPAKGQMVVFSASKGQEALDRLSDKDTNPNSVFTREFIARMNKPGAKIEDIVREVQDAVEDLAKTVKHEQRPALYNEARGNFYFYGPTTVQVSPVPAPVNPTISSGPDQREDKFWEDAKSTGNKEGFLAYIQAYPSGRYLNLAKANISRFESSSISRVDSASLSKTQTPPIASSQTMPYALTVPNNVSSPLINTEISNVNVVSGAGATFPFPIYSKWAENYARLTGKKINYQPIGSGAGIKQIKAKLVDFGASDMPLNSEDLDKDGLLQFPVVANGIVPVVNIAGIQPGQLKLNGSLIANIYLGRVTKWNDSSIRALNPSLNLPDSEINTIHRSDGTGTTYLFTNFLNSVSAEWRDRVGFGTSVNWPNLTNSLSGKGNEGVAANVFRVPNSIGYLEFSYVKQNRMNFVALQNRDGYFVVPNEESIVSSVANTPWSLANGFYEISTNEPGANSWPITGTTFIIMNKVQDKPDNARVVLQFFYWAFKNGFKDAQNLDYVLMPESVSRIIFASWREKIKDTYGKPIF